MKNLLLGLVMLFILVTGLQAQDASVSLTRNYVNGNTTWDTSFFYDIVHSRLVYPYGGRTHTLGINIKKCDIFLNFEMGLSNYGNVHFTKYDVKEGRDIDWSGNYLQYVSSSDIIFDNSDYKFNLGVELNNDISLFGSYYRYNSDFRMINGFARVQPGFLGLANSNKPFNALNSTYNVNYHALGFGINKCQDLLFGLLQLDGTFTYYPKFTIEGEGYWNLRDLIFLHKSRSGQQIIANFALFVKPIENFHVKIGYDIMKYWATGKTTKFGTIDLDDVENSWKINNITKGFNLGLIYNH